jgi:hypothetical protein
MDLLYAVLGQGLRFREDSRDWLAGVHRNIEREHDSPGIDCRVDIGLEGRAR